jgi:hypothetical protein
MSAIVRPPAWPRKPRSGHRFPPLRMLRASKAPGDGAYQRSGKAVLIQPWRSLAMEVRKTVPSVESQKGLGLSGADFGR